MLERFFYIQKKPAKEIKFIRIIKFNFMIRQQSFAGKRGVGKKANDNKINIATKGLISLTNQFPQFAAYRV
jgi:hypothetical protein